MGEKTKIAILGAGKEGKSLKKYLLKTEGFKKNQIFLLDKKTNPYYLDNLRNYRAIFRSPAIRYLDKNIQEAAKNGVKVSSATKVFFEAAGRRNPIIIGITGTKGKTTVAVLAHKILKAAGKKAYLAGNIGKPMTDIIAGLDKKSIAVLELSSFQLQDLNASPRISAILDITPDHQDAHKSFEEYVEAKSNIAKHQNKQDAVIFNVSNKFSSGIASQSAGRKIGLSLNSDDSFLKKIKKVLKLPGEHNLKNAYFAAAIAKTVEIPEKTILETIKKFRGIPFRIQKIHKNPETYNDSASTNPEAAIAAVKAINPDILIMGGLSKNLSYKKITTAIKKSKIKIVLLYGSNRFDLERKMPKNVIVKKSRTLEGLFEKCKRNLKTAEKILFSPGSASLDQFKNCKERGKLFNRLTKQYL